MSYFLTEPGASSATVLGREQWLWLQGLPALDAQQHVALTIVASSIQMVNNQSYDSENWGLYPSERERLLSLLRSWPCAVFVVSGDRHYSELAQECRWATAALIHCKSARAQLFVDACRRREGGVVLEVTTSGIDKARAFPQLQFDCNPFRFAAAAAAWRPIARPLRASIA